MAGKKKIPLTDITANEKKFCDHYLVDYNGTRAAIRAGYSKKTAASQASRLLRKVKVQEYLNSKTKPLAEKLEITQERTMREIGRIAYSDIRKIYNTDGSLRPIHEMDDDTAACIAGVEVEEKNIERFNGNNGRSRSTMCVIKKTKLWDKVRSLDMLAKHFGIYKEPEPPAPIVFNLNNLSPDELKNLLDLKRKMTKQ